MKHKLYNRLLSLALALGLVVGMLPGMTFAGAVDTTAPQSQAEQIAEPTEEPEANDAPQAEPRINTRRFTVKFVDDAGDGIGQADKTYTLSGNGAVTIQNIADSFDEISGYTFTNEAYIDRGIWGLVENIQQVRYNAGWFESSLQYNTTDNNYYGWENWPDDGEWWGSGNPYPLVLVYESNEEPEPTPTPDPTPEPSGDVYISDSIRTDGHLNANVSSEELKGQVSYYTWERSQNGNTDWETVTLERVSGDQYNRDGDGLWLNAALDRKWQEDHITDLDETMRYYYRINAYSADNTLLGTSKAYQVPYYFQLQNGSFETPQRPGGGQAGTANAVVGTPGLIWGTTASDNEIEFNWGNGLSEQYGLSNGVPEGKQIAELNANEYGSLYQDVLTAPGATLNWQLLHSSRLSADGGKQTYSGSDVMYVLIMSTDKAEDMNIQSNDDLKTVVNAINNKEKTVTLHGKTISLDGVSATYVEDGGDKQGGYEVSWDRYYRTSAGGEKHYYSRNDSKWFNSEWTRWSDTYSVPDNQYLTRFFFVSYSTAYDDNYPHGSSIKQTVGNLLDDISFGTDMPEPDPDRGHLKVVKTVTGVSNGDLPEDYAVEVTVTPQNGGQSTTQRIDQFTFDEETGNYIGETTFSNLLTGSYRVTESVSGTFSSDYSENESGSEKEDTANVTEGTTATANLLNAYTEDTSDEYPVRFYLEGIEKNQVIANYTFKDEWATLNADLIGGFANVTSTLYEGEGYPNLNGEQGYDSAVTGGSVPGGIQGHSNVETWLKKYNCAPNIDTDNIADVLDDLIEMYPQIANVPVTVVGEEEYTVSEIKNTLQTDPDAFQIVYTQVTKNHDAITEHFRGNGSVAGGQDSYHVHLSIRKNPGDLTITKTFAGLDEGVVPENFAIEVKASNGTLIDTLTLDEETKADGVYTWTLENLNEDTYTVTETGTDVDGKALNAAYKVTDSSDDTVESGNTTSAEVFVANNETSEVNFTNTYTDAEGVLKITKVITGSSFNDGRDVFNFKITKTDDPGKDTVYYVTIQGAGEANITLPAGTYKVEELDNLNYELTNIEGGEVNVSEGFTEVDLDGDGTTVTFTNNADPTDIPSDSGATQNNPDWQDDGDLVWKHDEGDDAIVSNPEKPGEKPTEN